MTLSSIAKKLSDEDKARELMERLRWPDGRPMCPHCGSVDRVYRIMSMPGSSTRKGLLKCAACRQQFTVTVGTIFEDSHIPLSKWLMAIQLLCASKKGMSAHQLHRMLGITYKSAWFMAHRIRAAMGRPPLSDKLRGIVEADETYVGGHQKDGRGRPAPGTKAAVMTLVERGGDARSFHVDRVTSKNLRAITREHIDAMAHVMTDEAAQYKFYVKKDHARHDTVKHAAGQYTRKTIMRGPDGEYVRGPLAHTQSVDNYYSLLKRGIYGVYHHVSKKHLHRYLSEFDYRYNRRGIKDGERAAQVVPGAEGKRLMYKIPAGGGSV
ncbi:MAG TPA: IS1595 family transposase [bacterium]|nr:IS1595 family transposase [bacterium]